MQFFDRGHRFGLRPSHHPSCEAGPFHQPEHDQGRSPLAQKMLGVHGSGNCPAYSTKRSHHERHPHIRVIRHVRFLLSLSGAALAAGNNQAAQPQPQAQPGKQSTQAVKPAPVVKPTSPVAPIAPNVRPGQPQQGRTQKDMLLKMSEDRKRQEKEREKQLKDARAVQVAPSKGNAPSAGKSAEGKNLNRTTVAPGR